MPAWTPGECTETLQTTQCSAPTRGCMVQCCRQLITSGTGYLQRAHCLHGTQSFAGMNTTRGELGSRRQEGRGSWQAPARCICAVGDGDAHTRLQLRQSSAGCGTQGSPFALHREGGRSFCFACMVCYYFHCCMRSAGHARPGQTRTRRPGGAVRRRRARPVHACLVSVQPPRQPLCCLNMVTCHLLFEWRGRRPPAEPARSPANEAFRLHKAFARSGPQRTLRHCESN